MKFKKLTLNENISEDDYSVVDYTLARAERFRDKKITEYEDAVKERNIQVPNEDKDAHDDIKTEPMKKMQLAESLFETYDIEEEASAIYELYERNVLDEIMDKIDAGMLSARTVALACLKYMSEDDVEDMVRANELLDDDEILEEDADGYNFSNKYGRYNRENLSNLENVVEITFPEVTVRYDVEPGTQYEGEMNFWRNSVAKMYLQRDSVKNVEAMFKQQVRAALQQKGYHSVQLGGSSLVGIPDAISIYAEDNALTEGIDGNESHAQGFVRALRSAGFGDGFDQKLKIDQYQTGTRIEYKDQGGHFIVTIMDDKVILESQDEGEEAFKQEFSNWEEFSSKFEELYPGIPVKENKILVEARKLPAMIDNYNREDGARYLVYKTREPLAYVIEAELTSGEICYLEKNGHVTQSVMPHKDYPVGAVSVQWDEWEMPFVKVWGPDKEYFNAAIEVAQKYGKDYEIHLDKYAKGKKKFWLEIIVDTEDTEEPYFDPEAPVYTSGKKSASDDDDSEMTGRHMKDNEDLEDSQRYPIESPQPAQTGLAMMEDVQMNGSLNEVRISTEGIRNFKPWDGAVETFNKILESGKMDEFERDLEERYPEGIGATELNDMLWFDKDAILNQLGIEE